MVLVNVTLQKKAGEKAFNSLPSGFSFSTKNSEKKVIVAKINVEEPVIIENVARAIRDRGIDIESLIITYSYSDYVSENQPAAAGGGGMDLELTKQVPKRVTFDGATLHLMSENSNPLGLSEGRPNTMEEELYGGRRRSLRKKSKSRKHRKTSRKHRKTSRKHRKSRKSRR